MRIRYESLKAYIKQYPGEECGPSIPSGRIMITTKEHKSYLQLKGETDEIFLDRLERSKKAGRNLFYEEWEPWEPLDGVDY